MHRFSPDTIKLQRAQQVDKGQQLIRLLVMATTIDFLEMRAFVAVVTVGSFTAAAQRLDTDKARVSRTVRRMEEKLGARLLNRSTRHLSVTDVGRDYFERASSILAAAEAAEAAVAQQAQEPQGRLKVTAGVEFGTTQVDAWIADFLQRWSKVSVETEYTNRLIDLVHESFDVAIRIGPLQDSGLSARKLGELSYGLYASPEYLRSRPDIQGVPDLADHDLIMHTPRGRPSWTLVNSNQIEKIARTPRCVVNNTITARNLALSGLGIVQLPQYLALQHIGDGTLEVVLPGWARSTVPVHAVFASTRYMDPKVRRFIDLCRERFRDNLSPSN
ncbi:DNA-binding transcriptional LysR family regulator [Rhizobium sp. BK512]|uniref:LysR family transcriptional regulator n=1 Tax=Rhizobium sp. BK512 TaxID=2587010 RepID=UPI0017D1BF21|nr:LysR family transcriptional regulator [Rhizobium sp. BK512]MBB3565617.1 DNA-binding transcriptional LysR family regulator [Rhizobium sp. BK512]